MQQVISGAMLALKLVSAYFLIVALFALKKPKPIPRANPKTRFACVIAARNEERVIGELVQSLLQQNYPKTLFDIYVMPNNCTDHTALAAIRAGAAILKPRGEVRCKGDALHEAFETLLRKDYDAFCVFDADNIADEQFLARMNDAFCAGAQVCKGAMRAKNPYDSWLSGCYGLYFTLFDTFFSRARMSCGLSSKLVGTGFAVHRAVLERFGGWNTSTIAEDAEFAAQCAANGVRVCFVPGALTYDEAPNDFAVSLRQRRRWCSGIMDVAVRMDAPLVSALRGSAPLRALDALLIVNAPFLQALTLLPLTLTILSSLVQGTAGTLALTGAVSLTLSTLGLMALAALLAYLGGYRDRRVVRTVAGFPLFMAAWLPLQLVSLVSRTRSWQPIAHTRAVRAENLHDAGFLTTI